METFKVEILNPEALKLLKNLADLNLIKIKDAESTPKDFLELLKELRKYSGNALSLEEITAEVESVRERRNK